MQAPKMFLVEPYFSEKKTTGPDAVLLLRQQQMDVAYKYAVPNQNIQVPFLNNYDPMYFNPRAYASWF